MLAQPAPTGSPETMSATVGATDHPPSTLGLADLIDEIKQTSERRILANRANAQLSTGPRSEEGKAKSSLNAVKTGLTGRTVLLPTDDAAIYQQHLDRHFAEFSPASDKEKALVQTIADTEWRLLRIAPLEAGIYAIGRRKLAGQFTDESDTANREALITAEVFLTYRKDLSNLALQERRLRNQRTADIAELQRLQQDRLQKRQNEIQRAMKTGNNCHHLKRDFDPAAHGFDFSFDEYMHYTVANEAQYPLTNTTLDFDTVLAAYRAAQKEPIAA
jgi:hypothetical protein